MVTSCRPPKPTPEKAKHCSPPRIARPQLPASGNNTDLDMEALAKRLAAVGDPADQTVYAYVITTVHLADGRFVQHGSAPNFDGGLITLCSCKHSMRATLTVEQWKRGIWVAGFTSWSKEFKKEQSLIYLMRVEEAYESQADLVFALRGSGRADIVDAKSSTSNHLGDLMVPRSNKLAGDDRFKPESYMTPMVGHAHRITAADVGWKDDIDYVGRGHLQAAMLAGDPQFSFNWTRQTIRRRVPSATRPYRVWSLMEFLDGLAPVSLA